MSVQNKITINFENIFKKGFLFGFLFAGKSPFALWIKMDQSASTLSLVDE